MHCEQRIARSLDPRPIYHHACGNFGDIFSTNCYLGPNIPMQEREEWPSRWAEKRPFPLVLCETCLMVICNWYRPREMPLEQVYSGEPIFDEITAQYLGRRAYRLLKPELFDRYDISKQTWGERLHGIIQHHPGYQEVKSRVARSSLPRLADVWRFGDRFRHRELGLPRHGHRPPAAGDEGGRPLFWRHDLYLAGPAGDWPSKRITPSSRASSWPKQAILLNDLTRDLPVALRWQVTDRAGKQLASSGSRPSSRQASTMYPIEFTAPEVSERREYRTENPARRRGGDVLV